MTIGGASTLEHLDMSAVQSDEFMWEGIRKQYEVLRCKTLWHQKLPVTRWLSTKRCLSWVLKAVDLTTAKSLEFVHFQLVPIAERIRPWNFQSPSFPPEAEVKVKKTYHYEPCPHLDVNPESLNETLLHDLLEPGPHTDHFWLNLFPKKLGEKLEYVESNPDATTGWGVRVVEGVNWTSVIFLVLVLIGINAVLGIVYSAATHDVGGGFSMAAFLSVPPALGIALLQLRAAV
jgi:hypothetical protein